MTRLRGLTESNLISLQLQERGFDFAPPKGIDLEYPCHDKSSGVTDFSAWKYFKERHADHFKAVSKQASSIWCPALMERVNRQQHYFEDNEKAEKVNASNTPLNKTNLAYRIRIQRAKAAAGRYTRSVAPPSTAGASDGSTIDGKKLSKAQKNKPTQGNGRSLSTERERTSSIQKAANKSYIQDQIVNKAKKMSK